MKKYCYFVSNEEHWFKVAEELYNKNIAKPVFWIGDDIHYKKARELFGDCVVPDLEFRHRIYNLNDIDYNGEFIEFFKSKNYSRAKDISIKMMDRLDIYGLFGRLDRETYFHYMVIWTLKNFNKSQPDVLICSEAPHDHVKYIVYEISLFLKIPCYKFNNWNLAPLMFLQNMETDEIIKKKANINFGNFDKILNTRIKYFVDGLLNKNKIHELSYMKDLKNKTRFFPKIFFFITKQKSVPSWESNFTSILKDIKHNIGMLLKSKYNPINPYKIGLISRILIQKTRIRNLKNGLQEIQQEVKLNNKYIYFPLHFEPERTTNPDGGFFQDQFLALSHLRKLVPDHIDIIVKEHPTQFYLSGRGVKGRSPLIYNLFKNIKRVKISNTNSSSLALIKKAEFIATITGSVAIEAAIIGKPALTFGSAWFKGCPNVIPWSDQITYDQIVKSKIKPKEEIISYLIQHKDKHSIIGFTNGTFRKIHKDYVSKNFEYLQNRSVFKLLESLINDI